MALGNAGSIPKLANLFGGGKLLISTKSYEGLSSDGNSLVPAATNPSSVTAA